MSEVATGLELLWGEFNLSYSGDDWDHVMSWWFAVADVLTTSGDGTPADWEFRQSPLGPNEDSYEYQTLVDLWGKYSIDDLVTFGQHMFDEADRIRSEGRDY